MRQAVGGAQSEVTLQSTRVSSSAFALKRGWLAMKTVAPAIQGAKKQDQACLAQPAPAMAWWMSPGIRPSQYIDVRWPTA